MKVTVEGYEIDSNGEATIRSGCSDSNGCVQRKIFDCLVFETEFEEH
jgi:hypothetical protein